MIFFRVDRVSHVVYGKNYFVLSLEMVSYTLVSQQWVAACPLNLNELDVCPFDMHPDQTICEKPEEPSPVASIFRPVRRFSRVISTKLEAQRIRSRLTRIEVANHAGISLSVFNEIITGRSIISPIAAARLETLFNRDIRLYPRFPSPAVVAIRSPCEVASAATSRDSTESRSGTRRGRL